ncbi:unnamed protein product, partial [Cylicostephanus goldi]
SEWARAEDGPTAAQRPTVETGPTAKTVDPSVDVGHRYRTDDDMELVSRRAQRNWHCSLSASCVLCNLRRSASASGLMLIHTVLFLELAVRLLIRRRIGDGDVIQNCSDVHAKAKVRTPDSLYEAVWLADVAGADEAARRLGCQTQMGRCNCTNPKSEIVLSNCVRQGSEPVKTRNTSETKDMLSA